MLRLRRILARLGNLFRNHRAEKELAREVASHLALIADDFERQGMSPQEAQLGRIPRSVSSSSCLPCACNTASSSGFESK